MIERILIAALVLAVSHGGLYLWAHGKGGAAEQAAQAREDKAAREAREAALQVTAEAISKIEVKNVQIRQPLETVVRTERVFVECRSGADAVRLLNSTPGVRAEPAGDRPLQAAP